MTQSIIQFRNVNKVFTNPSNGQSTVAVQGVNFDIKQGEFFCLLGPSGCGKSTILNMLSGFEKPTTGEVLMDNQLITGPGVDRGIVFQQPTLYPWMNVIDNINFGPFLSSKKKSKEDMAKAEAYVRQVGLQGFSQHKPYELSGGMQQRVGIARALINEPKILLMDEPFGALDAQTRTEMQSFLLELWQKIRSTVLFITHDIDEAILLGDRLGIMSSRPGRISEIINVDIPRPRHYESTLSEEFVSIKRKVLALLNH
jgi:NitT/TauT family transport system ATP-binding protein